ncbi:uncharacterized protein EDB93DRAFT_719916 [Suillus bovinus]|uniref:uncharacterized protein n=1 Tax=Suillus bovinus TaxID=48563 RepID=UPI001B885A2A|nr:uncharacterized protein EDB93DRAFT_719916 [Suillus bovinus]KAG2138632.1 hypothetical protein EDB93DRAFT_719916 [Suillus bovinus]
MMSLHGVLERSLAIVRLSLTRLSEVFRGPVHVAGTFARRSLQQLITRLQNWLSFVVSRVSTKVVDSEAQALDLNLDTLSEDEYAVTLPDIPTSNLEAPSVKWLLETSTDPEVFLAAASLVPQVEWTLDLDTSDMLYQLYDTFTDCVGFDGKIMPSLEEKASACLMAMSHLYYGRVFQVYPDRDEFLGRGRRDCDYDVLSRMQLVDMGGANDMVLRTTMNLCLPENDRGMSLWYPLHGCPDSVMEWLSHSLTYHFVTGRVHQDIERFAIDVISELLSSSSSPSNQIVANCTLLACVMVGVQFDKKDIVRIDKSSSLPQFVNALLAKFQMVLREYDGGDLDKDSTGVTRRAWKLLDVICLMLESAKDHYPTSRSVDVMRNLDACRKIYSRLRSPEQNDPWELLKALKNGLRFTLTAAKVSRDPARWWHSYYLWSDDSHPPEDFDWLVDCPEYIYYNEEMTFDILLFLVVMKARCSPAKQHQFFKSLIACMGSNMPKHLRYIALRAAHDNREAIASIDAIHDVELRDMILTELSPAILTAVCPQPGTTYSSDDSDSDLCYLELLFALTRNSNWHPHLSRDHHIDRCISIIAKCRLAEQPAFYLVGILLRIAPERLSVTSLDSIMVQRWWDVLDNAWFNLIVTEDIHCFELLPVLVEGTKKHMQISPEYGLKHLTEKLDAVLEVLERRNSEQGEGECIDIAMTESIVAVKELRTVAGEMLEKLIDSEGVIP